MSVRWRVYVETNIEGREKRGSDVGWAASAGSLLTAAEEEEDNQHSAAAIALLRAPLPVQSVSPLKGRYILLWHCKRAKKLLLLIKESGLLSCD